ncbi:MAG: carboxypeptidase regulatory-like domain-containing protein [Candidatus Electryonea clarkiae]|nr:carboxypeptidase regulatory-like domain-containing protein [Candidatus Electryonea clarkiae]MDP8287494.1 carboxypeptidase regulatory-like domain-containing protein [Candidatus Electryonea clarkiae]
MNTRFSSILVVLLFLSSCALGQDSLGISLLDATITIDDIRDVDIEGDIIYIAANVSGVVIVSIENNEVNLLSQIPRGEGDVDQVKVNGNRLAVRKGDEIHIYDIADPENPEFISDTEMGIGGFSMYGSMVWIGNILTVNSSRSASILHMNTDGIVSEISVIDYDIQVSSTTYWNNIIYAVSSSGFLAFDISDPEEPEEVELGLDISGNGIAINDGIAAISNDDSVTFIDLTQVGDEEIISTWITEGENHLYDPCFIGNYLVVREWSESIRLIDIQDIENPALVNSLEIEDAWFGGCDQFEDRIVYANRSDGLMVVEVSDEEYLDRTIDWDPVSLWTRGTILGDNVIFGTNGNGVQVFSNQEPDELPFIDSYPGNEGSNGRVYEGDENISIIRCYGGDNPTDPYLCTPDPDEQLGFRTRGALSSSLFALNMTDSILFASSHTTITVYDISDIDNPDMITNFYVEDTRGIYYYQDALYVAGHDDGMVIFDVSDPSDPEIIDTLHVWFGLLDLFLGKDNLLFISMQAETNRIDIYSLEDPFEPEVIGSIVTPGWARKLWNYEDGLLLVSENIYRPASSVLEVYNIADHRNLELVAWYPVGNDLQWATLDGRRIIASWRNGVGLFELDEDLVAVGTVEGTVTGGENGDAIEGALVRNSNGTWITTTDEFGHYQLEGVLAGTYDFECSAEGYDLAISEDIEVAADQVTELNFELIEENALIENNSSPLHWEFTGCSPNPFNSMTTVRFTLKSSAHVNVVVNNLLGQEIEILANGTMSRGHHSLSFDATGLPSGIYFIHVNVLGKMDEFRKVVLLK